MTFSSDEISALPKIISSPRFRTYLSATGGQRTKALKLYHWNLKVSSAFIIPLQICEVASRNGVVLALEHQYGQDWHNSERFLISLHNPKKVYSPKKDIMGTKANLIKKRSLTAGKVVADLKFAFWESMLTARHDNRLWIPYFNLAFPHASNPPTGRKRANEALERVRRLRNRIAHHEPIFHRDLTTDYNTILCLIGWRDPVARQWAEKIQDVTNLLTEKPIP